MKSISWYQEMYSEAPLCYKVFLDIKNLISWFQEMEFLISRMWFVDIKKWSRNGILDINNWFLDIKNSISWYQEIHLISWYQEMCIISWYQEVEFLILRYAFFDIKNSFSWYQFEFLISGNRILDIKKYLSFLDITKSNSWYQKIEFLISRILDIKNSISWYQEIEFLISKTSWYQKYFLISRIYFLIPRNRILDIKKCWIDSQTAPHTCFSRNTATMGCDNSFPSIYVPA